MGEVISLESRRAKGTEPPPAPENNHDNGEAEVIDIERQMLTRLEGLLAAYEACRQNLRDTRADIKRYAALQKTNPEVGELIAKLAEEQNDLIRDLGEMSVALETLKKQAASTRARRTAKA